jgi:hypothetical protein
MADHRMQYTEALKDAPTVAQVGNLHVAASLRHALSTIEPISGIDLIGSIEGLR